MEMLGALVQSEWPETGINQLIIKLISQQGWLKTTNTVLKTLQKQKEVSIKVFALLTT